MFTLLMLIAAYRVFHTSQRQGIHLLPLIYLISRTLLFPPVSLFNCKCDGTRRGYFGRCDSGHHLDDCREIFSVNDQSWMYVSKHG